MNRLLITPKQALIGLAVVTAGLTAAFGLVGWGLNDLSK